MNCDLHSLLDEAEEYDRLSSDELARIVVFLQCHIAGITLNADTLIRSADNLNFLEGPRLQASQVLALATAANLATLGPYGLLAAAAPLAGVPPGRMRDISKFLNCGMAAAIAAGGGGTCSNKSGVGDPTGIEVPDFIGQTYLDTSVDNVWTATGFTPTDWTLTVSPTGSRGTNVNKFGMFTYGNSGTLGAVIITDVSCLPGYDFEDDPNIATLAWPNLTEIDPFNLQGGYLYISACAGLLTIDLPVLTFCPGQFFIIGNNALTSVSMPELLETNLDIHSNPLLTDFDGPSSTFSNGFNLQLDGNAFSQASTDLVLARLVANPAYVSGNVNLSGGTNSPPSSTAPGSDFDILFNRGVTLLIN